ncbi:MAG: hypothetical protein EU539_01045 [Promethearchaeota archaeon]|nr:MAG: hypothetical protein EU539_01045 [Candidatus Lokiarchaeota archaeon]
MENDNNPEIEKAQVELSEIKDKLEEKAKETIDPSRLKDMASDLKVDGAISDLFYESVKLFFDIGFDLADKLNLELIGDLVKKKEKKEEEK